MLLFDKTTPRQEEIIKEICYQQLISLERIFNNQHHGSTDIVMMLIENEIDEDHFKEMIMGQINKFKQLKENPDSLSKMDDTSLSQFRHILSNIENQYKEKYPNAISNLWNRLFIIEEFKNSILDNIN